MLNFWPHWGMITSMEMIFLLFFPMLTRTWSNFGWFKAFCWWTTRRHLEVFNSDNYSVIWGRLCSDLDWLDYNPDTLDAGVLNFRIYPSCVLDQAKRVLLLQLCFRERRI